MMRPVPGWPGYHATDDGRVFSTCCRVHIGGLTWAPSTGGELRELRPFDRKTVRGKPSPYLSVCMSRDGRRTNRYVHEVIASTFLGPRPEGYEICHGEAGSLVNAVGNLRYGTPEENSAERKLSRGDAWYRARGMRPPSTYDVVLEAAGAAIEESAHAFSDLIERATA